MQKLPLLSIQQHLDIYHALNASQPSFGMDVYAEDFEPHGLIVLQNSGKGSRGVPIRCAHYVLILTLRGGSVRHINQHDYRVPQHGIQLLVPGVIHSFEDTEPNSEFYVLLFEPRFLPEGLEELMDFHRSSPEYVQLEGSGLKRVVDIYEQLNLAYKLKAPEYQEIARHLLAQLLYLLKQGKLAKPKEVIQNRSEQITSNFLCLIESHFQSRKTVQAYADILEITPKHLSETIKTTLNKTALYFIHQRIIKEIQYLLVHSNLSIKQIAASLHFENSSEMGRFFKRYEGISPKNFKLAQKNNQNP